MLFPSACTVSGNSPENLQKIQHLLTHCLQFCIGENDEIFIVQSTKILHFHQTNPETGDCNAVYYCIIERGDCQAFFYNFFLFLLLFCSFCEKQRKVENKMNKYTFFFFTFFQKPLAFCERLCYNSEVYGYIRVRTLSVAHGIRTLSS